MSIFSFEINIMKKFLYKLFAYITILCIITIILNFLYVRLDNFDFYVVDKFYKMPNNIQICNFGSSHGMYGFNYENFDKKYVCFNFALSSQTLSYDYRLLKYYEDNISEGCLIIIPISYFSFFGKGEIYDSNFETKNSRYYKILPSNFIKQYKWKTNFYMNNFPLLVEYSRLPKLLLGLNDTPMNEWNKTAETVNVKDDAYKAYRRHLIINKFDDNGKRIFDQDEIHALYEIIKLCKNKKFIPVLVTTPFLYEYNQCVQNYSPEFLSIFQSIITKVTNNTEIKYYDYSHDKRFLHDYSLFMNSDHLNKKGAIKFTNIVFNEVLGLGVAPE